MEPARPSVLRDAVEHGVVEQLAACDHVVDADDIHLDDAAGADVEMAHFAIAHLTVGQPDERSVGANRG